jgi:hypothetical protein
MYLRCIGAEDNSAHFVTGLIAATYIPRVSVSSVTIESLVQEQDARAMEWIRTYRRNPAACLIGTRHCEP